MEINKDLLNKFKKIKNVFYDEEKLEFKIFKHEFELKKTLSLNEKNKYDKLLLLFDKLNDLKALRLIDFIKKNNS